MESGPVELMLPLASVLAAVLRNVRRLPWGPELAWLLSQLSLRLRMLRGRVCSRSLAADVQTAHDLQTLLLAAPGEAPTSGDSVRLSTVFV